MSQEMEGNNSNEIWGLGCGPDPAHETQTKLIVPARKRYIILIYFFPLKRYHLVLLIPPKFLKFLFIE